MDKDDIKQEIFEESELVAVRFEEVEGTSCCCGTLLEARPSGNAYCPACAEKGKETIH